MNRDFRWGDILGMQLSMFQHAWPGELGRCRHSTASTAGRQDDILGAWRCSQVAPAASNKKGSLLIPRDEVKRVMTEVAVQPGPTGLLKLAGIKNIVEGWCAKPPCP